MVNLKARRPQFFFRLGAVEGLTHAENVYLEHIVRDDIRRGIKDARTMESMHVDEIRVSKSFMPFENLRGGYDRKVMFNEKVFILRYYGVKPLNGLLVSLIGV